MDLALRMGSWLEKRQDLALYNKVLICTQMRTANRGSVEITTHRSIYTVVLTIDDAAE